MKKILSITFILVLYSIAECSAKNQETGDPNLYTGILTHRSELPYPYNQLSEILPYMKHGWYENAVPMEKLIKKTNAKIVIELGSWLGLSTCHISETLPDDGVVYAVDHWLGNSQSIIHTPELIPALYEQFLSNMIHANLTHKVVPLRMTTQDAAAYFYENNIMPDIIYVDASHQEQDVYDDIQTYFPLIEGHGIICGDDWSYGDYPIRKAVERFAKENDLEIVVSNDWFWQLVEKDRPQF